MGFSMSRYDDVRLDGCDGGLETRRESFYLRWPAILVCANRGNAPTLEIAYEDVPRLREFLDVAMAHGAGEGDLEPPSPDQADTWRREEDDAELVQAGDKFTDDDLRRLLQLRQEAAVSD